MAAAITGRGAYTFGCDISGSYGIRPSRRPRPSDQSRGLYDSGWHAAFGRVSPGRTLRRWLGEVLAGNETFVYGIPGCVSNIPNIKLLNVFINSAMYRVIT